MCFLLNYKKYVGIIRTKVETAQLSATALNVQASFYLYLANAILIGKLVLTTPNLSS